jgi:hypothetical protein
MAWIRLPVGTELLTSEPRRAGRDAPPERNAFPYNGSSIAHSWCSAVPFCTRRACRSHNPWRCRTLRADPIPSSVLRHLAGHLALPAASSAASHQAAERRDTTSCEEHFHKRRSESKWPAALPFTCKEQETPAGGRDACGVSPVGSGPGACACASASVRTYSPSAQSDPAACAARYRPALAVSRRACAQRRPASAPA